MVPRRGRECAAVRERVTLCIYIVTFSVGVKHGGGAGRVGRSRGGEVGARVPGWGARRRGTRPAEAPSTETGSRRPGEAADAKGARGTEGRPISRHGTTHRGTKPYKIMHNTVYA